ncbi:MAG: AzlC family ABC transporter permease [Litorivicinaceae bacterium]
MSTTKGTLSPLHAGAWAILPLTPGIVPFGLIAGVTPVQLGYHWIDSALASLLIFAGASQIAAYQLIAQDSALWVIVLTVVAVNLRYVLYSASIAPHLSEAPWPIRIAAAYGLTDQRYAVCLHTFAVREFDLRERVLFYFGGVGGIWGVWQSATLVGALAGQVIPRIWSLEFMIPLSFFVLALSTVRRPPHRTAAILGGGVAALLMHAPFNLGLITGASVGVLGGLLHHRWRQPSVS